MNNAPSTRRYAILAGMIAGACGLVGFAVNRAGPDSGNGWFATMSIPGNAAVILVLGGAALALFASYRLNWVVLVSRLAAVRLPWVYYRWRGYFQVVPLSPTSALGFALASLGLLLVGHERSATFTASLGFALASVAVCLITASAELFPLAGGAASPGNHMGLLCDIGLVSLAVGILVVQPTQDLMRIFAQRSPMSLWARRLLIAVVLAPPGLGLLQLALAQTGIGNFNVILSSFAFICAGVRS